MEFSRPTLIRTTWAVVSVSGLDEALGERLLAELGTWELAGLHVNELADVVWFLHHLGSNDATKARLTEVGRWVAREMAGRQLFSLNLEQITICLETFRGFGIRHEALEGEVVRREQEGAIPPEQKSSGPLENTSSPPSSSPLVSLDASLRSLAVDTNLSSSVPSKDKVQSDGLGVKLARFVTENVEDPSPSQTYEMLRALTRAEPSEHRTVHKAELLHLLGALAEHAPSLPPRLQAMTLYSLTKLVSLFGRMQLEPVLARLAAGLAELELTELSPQVLADTLWAYAHANLTNDSLDNNFTRELLTRDLTAFNAKDLTNILEAYATLRLRHQELFDLVANELLSRDLSTLKGKEIASILWALARLGVKHDGLFDYIVQELLARELNTFTPPTMVNTLRAFKQLDLKQDELKDRLARELVARDLETFKPIDIVNTIGVFTALNIPYKLW